ncbi:A-kinase anchor protein 14 [Salarias fasciatus]|uniref:A-kinase anchor protein 14 n=1 Tax=Salarias fasciatus TaxID=181472 RepID=UPI001176CF4D|nr:A-kinase anchor protein 14 [Salarias fasciatus]
MNRDACDATYAAESSHLVKAVLERHRLTRQQDDQHPDKEANIRWPACQDFTVEEGKKHIASYIQTWELQDRWIFSLDFLYSTEEEYCTLYHYRARFSTPTPQRPIQGTASVYFAVDVSKVKPGSLPVQVHFVVESNRLVHTPGSTSFREKWLQDVIEGKTLLEGALTF